MTTFAISQSTRIDRSDQTVLDLLDLMTCLRRALERVGARSCSRELLDAADVVEMTLPVVSELLDEHYGANVPASLRAAVTMLAGMADATTADVPSLLPHLDELLASTEQLIADLDR